MHIDCPDPFSTNGTWLRGNLHAHSTNSDGLLAPDAVIDAYRRNGYDFLAFTEHNTFTPQQADSLLVLAGEELDFECDGLYHIVAIGTNRPLGIDATRRRTLSVREAFEEVQRAGGLGILAHPYWSNQRAANAVACSSAVGVEVYNHGCEMDNANGLSATYWDEMLRSGLRTWGVASDDSHHHGRNATIVSDALGGWIRVKARERSCEAVTEAIRNGLFYSSSGPDINAIHFDDGRVHVESSPVSSICLRTPQWGGWCVRNPDGTPMTHAVISLPPTGMVCGRIECTDQFGRRAWSNPFWIVH